MPFASTLSRLAEVAEDQWGLITRRQAEAARVPPATITRLIGSGVLERVAHGVYRLVGVPPAHQPDPRAPLLPPPPRSPARGRVPQPGGWAPRLATRPV